MDSGAITYLLQGLLLGLAYLAPIGMQNMYVINTALRMGRLRTYQVAGITTAFDISLALSRTSAWASGSTTRSPTGRHWWRGGSSGNSRPAPHDILLSL